MAIKITQLESETRDFIKDGKLYSTLYGVIDIVDTINTDEYSWFDEVLGYDLFVNNNTSETVAVNVENLHEDVNKKEDLISSTIDNINAKYEVSTVKYDDVETSIIVKVSEDNESVIDDIEKEYKDNKMFEIQKITSRVLFLKVLDIETQLEDNSAIDRLSDQDIKNVITKAGVKLSGTENKERLKGIMQGVLSTAK